MGELITEIKDKLDSTLNAHSISPDSIEGIVIMFAIGFIIWGIYRRALKFVKWSLSVILICEIMYWLGRTSFNDIVPVANVFKHDILTSIAQCFVGTKVCDGILWVDAFIRSVIISLWNVIAPHSQSIVDFFKGTAEQIGDSVNSFVEPLPTEVPTPTPLQGGMSIFPFWIR